LGVLVLILSGCSGGQRSLASANVVAALSGDLDEGFARAYEPIPFEFPRDHGAHPQYRTEWWYYTGNLEDDRGNQYGYQFTIFRSALTPEMSVRESNLATNQVYLAHFALTNVRSQRHVSFERYSRGDGRLAGAEGEPVFRAWLEDWQVEEIEPGVLQMAVAARSDEGEEYALELLLQETRLPVKHGNSGLSRKGPEPGNASYYYSLVGLETSGSLTWSGDSVSVSGVSWMDHEFGTSALSKNAVGWDWFSVQLDNDYVLMFADIRTDEGGRVNEMEGTLVRADGTQTTLGVEDVRLDVLGQWTSPQTGIVYPSTWRAVLPEHGIDLEITPLVRDQEMTLNFLYWEGAVSAIGTADGEPVRGNGYVELTGYGEEGQIQPFRR
jgi:predicted secreted hydrolase